MTIYFIFIPLFIILIALFLFYINRKKRAAAERLQEIADRRGYKIEKKLGNYIFEVVSEDRIMQIFPSITDLDSNKDGILLSATLENLPLKGVLIRKRFSGEDYSVKQQEGKVLLTDLGYDDALRIYAEESTIEKSKEILKRNPDFMENIIALAGNAYTLQISENNNWLRIDYRTKGALRKTSEIEQAIDEVLILLSDYVNLKTDF
jgi:hypothetical protein